MQQAIHYLRSDLQKPQMFVADSEESEHPGCLGVLVHLHLLSKEKKCLILMWSKGQKGRKLMKVKG